MSSHSIGTEKVPTRGIASTDRATAVVGFLVFIEFASGFVQGYYTPLLPRIADHFSVTAADLNWFTSVQTLASAVCVPLLAKLGDTYGHRRVLRIAIISVMISVILLAFAPNFTVALIARVLIGPLAVWLPLEVALVHNRIHGETARRAISYLVAMLTGGAIVGSLVAGPVSQTLPSMTFTLLVPLVAVALSLFAVFIKVPESDVRNTGKIDVMGFLGLGLALLLLLWGLGRAPKDGIGSSSTLVPVLLALLVLAAWIVWERRVENPAINLSVVASGTLGPLYVASFCFGFITFGNLAPLTTFLSAKPETAGYGFALTATGLSLFVASTSAVATVGSLLSPLASARVGLRRVLVVSAILGALFFVLQAVMHQSLWQTSLQILLAYLAIGVFLGTMPALVAELSPPSETAISVGLYNTVRTIGGSVAGATVAVLLSSLLLSSGATSVRGYQAVWIASAIAFTLAAVAVGLARAKPTEMTHPSRSH
ncbi:MFS transporter [Rhodococcus erythropolis]|uniref:MFS transporter n=1 Tax=Rhodococcus erythropolis TaxID=1833 RepID=UPI001E37D3D3|nr:MULTISPECIES: MFS transporter [Rhodococcus erythropolis group]MCD2109249.1 MFS transporter [Rhodococcus qingshengii]MCZ4528173.1 MFS transporter [Rhodococcus erythropolis]